MILYKNATDLAAYLQKQKSMGQAVSFVPTMGALHEGHLSLVRAAKKQSGIVVCSIFVNPTQFNDPKDFQKYPVTIEKDIFFLEKNAVDALFLPSVEGLYPNGLKDMETYELGPLENIWEGKYRPGHFQGVCQVMRRLLDIVQPDHLYMGQKDFQQCMVVKKLLQIIQSPTLLHDCPTLRESDGLAMSSRNMRLTDSERKKATAIYQALSYLKTVVREGNFPEILEKAASILKSNDFRIDYITLVDAETLQPATVWVKGIDLVCLIAAYQHEVRLIDNMMMSPGRDDGK